MNFNIGKNINPEEEKYLKVFINIDKYLKVFINIYKCLKVFINIFTREWKILSKKCEKEKKIRGQKISNWNKSLYEGKNRKTHRFLNNVWIFLDLMFQLRSQIIKIYSEEL